VGVDRPVLDDHDLSATPDQGAGHGLAGDPEADHEGPGGGQSMSPVPRKSA
jgi:hypothetical protein